MESDADLTRLEPGAGKTKSAPFKLNGHSRMGMSDVAVAREIVGDALFITNGRKATAEKIDADLRNLIALQDKDVANV